MFKYNSHFFSKCLIFPIFFLLMGCGKKQTPLQKKENLISSSHNLYNNISSKYEKELAILNSGRTSNQIKKKLIKCAANKKCKQSIWSQLFDDMRLSSQNIPLHLYCEDLESSSLKKLMFNEKKLLKIIDFVGASESLLKIQTLIANLVKIKSILIKSKDYRDENRFMSSLTSYSGYNSFNV